MSLVNLFMKLQTKIGYETDLRMLVVKNHIVLDRF